MYEEGAPQVDPGLFELGVPVLGICYGHQLMARALGGEVAATGQREYGGTTLTVDVGFALLQDFPPSDTVWMSHGDAVTREPDGFRVTARPIRSRSPRWRIPSAGMYAVQFHPEVSHTVARPGRDEAVPVRRRATCCPTGRRRTSSTTRSARIRAQVGDAQVLCALSGGVDSAVAALLVHRAMGDQLTCVFVDHGLNREGEPDQVEETFARHFRIPLVHVKAADRFLGRLAGVTDPEVKRKAIGEEFIRVFEEVAREHVERDVPGAGHALSGRDRVAARRPPPTSRATTTSGGLARGHGLRARRTAARPVQGRGAAGRRELGLPEEIVQRQPFPGPGLAVRIVGEVTAENLAKVRGADRVVREEIRRAGLERETWQAFCVLLADVQSVGVMGDGRTYENPVIVRAVTSEDAMTADWARLPADVLDTIASRIVREVPGVNRVAYDITSKPPGTIEWE